jgi:glutamate/tyrosine decarboxylase-like PLP-dependent enzyme
MRDVRQLLHRTADLAADFLESLETRRVFPSASAEELRAELGMPLPKEPTPDAAVLEDLADAGERGVVALPSGRYFGFVIGGALPAALTADWLTSAWDQNAGLYAGGPSASVVEQVAGDWLKQLLGLPERASIGFVTGTQMAHVTGLAAARFHVLDQVGWDVGRDGLTGSPPIRVLVGEKRHVTVDRALRLLGLGAPTPVATDRAARMDPAALSQQIAKADGPTIVCAQVGEVNTGAIDPLAAIADVAEDAGAWLHVDGAFGLWAAAVPRLRPLVAGVERASSWTADAHKWLNVPYDSGFVICAYPESHRAAMAVTASYLIQDGGARSVRDEMDWVPEFSRRARGFAVYAALRSLGEQGVVDLVERACECARRFAEQVVDVPGVELLNEVLLNQVLFRFETDEQTSAVLERVQAGGEVWMSGTSWDGRPAIRLSVSNWQTGDEEIDLAVEAFRKAVQPAGAGIPAR